MRRRVLAALVLVGLFGLIAFIAAGFPTADFYGNFYAAARNVLNGHSPYDAVGYICAPWGVIPLIPYALLPPLPAHGLYFATCLYILIYIAWRLDANPLAIVAFILSPTAVGALLVGNLDAVVISGMLFPPIVGLLVLLIKPQIGAGVALYYLGEWLRSRNWLEGVRSFLPSAAAFGLAAIFFPIWIIRAANNTSDVWNRTLFPYSIPVAALLLWIAFRNRNPYFALASTAFFAPYLSFYTYIIVQIGLLHKDVEKYVRRDVLQVALCIFLWVIMLKFRL